jgi:hypothetical protein
VNIEPPKPKSESLAKSMAGSSALQNIG